MGSQEEFARQHTSARRGNSLRYSGLFIVVGLAVIAILGSRTPAPKTIQRQVPMANVLATETDVPLTSTYGLLTTKPYGKPGVVNELSLDVWGPYSWRQGGDPYSPLYDPANGPTYPNQWHDDQPYGYLYRVEVPASFPDDELVVQIFDPDTYNNQTPMPTPSRTPTRGASMGASPSPTIPPSYTPYANDPRYFWCSGQNDCTANDADFDKTGLRLNGYNRGDWVQPPWTSGRSAVWRVDEYRQLNTAGSISPPAINSYDARWPTESNFSMWHFTPDSTSIYGNPYDLSDQPDHGPIVVTYTARYNPDPAGNYTDLAWFQPWTPIKLSDPTCTGHSGNDCFAREANGNLYFYVYVSTTNGSSENDYEIRVGPKAANYATGYNCTNLTAGPSGHSICYSNEQFFEQMVSPTPPADWDDGGAKVFAARSLALNLNTGAAFPMLYNQVSKDLAGQNLSVRHFDQDCSLGCTTPIPAYQLQLCVADGQGGYTPCANLLDTNCFGDVAPAYRAPNNGWYCAGCPNPEGVPIPAPGSPGYTQFFGPNGECSTSWLRLKQNLSYSNDTTAWEVILPDGAQVPATATPSSTPTYTFTSVPTSTTTPSHTATSTPSNTPSDTPTNSPTNTATRTPTNSPTSTPTNSPTHSPTPSSTPSNTPTNSPTGTQTPVPTNTVTNTPTNSPTNTPSNSPTRTPTRTNTPTNSPTNTPTNTPLPTQTQVGPSATTAPSNTATTLPDQRVQARGRILQPVLLQTPRQTHRPARQAVYQRNHQQTRLLIRQQTFLPTRLLTH